MNDIGNKHCDVNGKGIMDMVFLTGKVLVIFMALVVGMVILLVIGMLLIMGWYW